MAEVANGGGRERAPADVPALARKRQGALLDAALEETFPASDPIPPALLRTSRAAPP